MREFFLFKGKIILLCKSGNFKEFIGKKVFSKINIRHTFFYLDFLQYYTILYFDKYRQ